MGNDYYYDHVQMCNQVCTTYNFFCRKVFLELYFFKSLTMSLEPTLSFTLPIEYVCQR